MQFLLHQMRQQTRTRADQIATENLAGTAGNVFNTAFLPNFETFDSKKESFRNNVLKIISK